MYHKMFFVAETLVHRMFGIPLEPNKTQNFYNVCPLPGYQSSNTDEIPVPSSFTMCILPLRFDPIHEYIENA